VGCFCQLERRAEGDYGLACTAPSTFPYMTPSASKPRSESRTSTKARAHASISQESSVESESATFQRRP